MSLLHIKSINISSSSTSCYGVVIIPKKSCKIVCQVEKSNSNREIKKWKAIVSTALAAAVITFSTNMTAMADLNKFEAETRGEFGIGSAHLNLVFLNISFILESDFSGSTFNGAYLEKAVAYKANFSGQHGHLVGVPILHSGFSLEFRLCLCLCLCLD
ncbi:hypothetical protein RND71_042773 [Anisodus tanguticus]|uniref:Uncharacterized protein n=1 Tax=Anisodus tanguticus TaxID=243964 RepID=A0AAE1QRL7_9SOLA|nr:hypothetical protein RND71_042773 [Anisodus tanguticus]